MTVVDARKVCEEVVTVWGDRSVTHSETCHLRHPQCLAEFVLELLEDA